MKLVSLRPTITGSTKSKSQELDLNDQSIEAARLGADLIPTPTSLRILVSKVVSEDQKALVVRAKRLL